MKKSNNKIYVAFVVICLIFLVILARSFQLQVLEHRELSDKAIALSKLDLDIEPVRGDILDANGNVLATSTKYYDFWVSQGDINYENLDEDGKEKFEEELEDLAGKLSITKEELRGRIFTEHSSNLIAKSINKELADKIREDRPRWLAVVSRYKRVYPYQSLACHLIGVTDEDGVGLSGLEMGFNDQLSGTRGKYVIDTDLHGNALALSDTKRYPATDGSVLKTTLDINIQQYTDYWTEKLLVDAKASRVTMIVMDTKEGSIKALSSPPFFDLNEPYKIEGIEGLSGEDYVDFLYQTWGNPAVESLYDPGSVSKVLTVAAGLEDGALEMESQFYCDGSHHFPVDGEDISIQCWVYPDAHGQQNTTSALVNSCNPAFIQMGTMIGGDRLYHYLESFGIGRRTRVELGNEAFPQMSKPTNIVEEGTMTYGYGYAVSPLQMATALNGIVNNGDLMQTRIYEGLYSPQGEVIQENSAKKLRSVITPHTSAQVRSMLEAIVVSSDGELYETEGIPMGGKTGTTMLMKDGVYSEEFGKRLAYFLTAPINDPRYSIYIYADQPEDHWTSTATAEYGINLMKEILYYDGYGVSQFDESAFIEVPLLEGHTPSSALEYLSDIGLGTIFKNYDSLDEEAKVQEQFPKAGEMVLEGANIMLNFGADMSGLHKHPKKKGLYETYIPDGTLLPETPEEYYEEDLEDETDQAEGGDDG